MTRSERKRRGLGGWMFQIFGPANVQGALQGHSPEARAAWKRRVEADRERRRKARSAQA